MKGFHLLISDVKDFMTNEINWLFVWVLIVQVLSLALIHYELSSLKVAQAKENEKLSVQIEQVRKRVDFRYFNLSRTLEDIYGVKIDTHQGELKN